MTSSTVPPGTSNNNGSGEFDAKLFEGLELVSVAYAGLAKRHEATAAALRRDVAQLTDERAALRARESSLSAQLAAAVERNDALEREQRRLLNENAQLGVQVRQFEARTAKLESFKRAIMSTFDGEEPSEQHSFGLSTTSTGASHSRGGVVGTTHAAAAAAAAAADVIGNANVVSSLPRARAVNTTSVGRSTFATSYLPSHSLMSTLTPEDLEGPRRANGTTTATAAATHDNELEDIDNDDNDATVARIVDDFIAYARANMQLADFKALLELIEARHQMDYADVLAKARLICQSHPESLRRFTAVVEAMRNVF
jgi:hypothetical protein